MEKKRLSFQKQSLKTLDNKYEGEEIKVFRYIPYQDMLLLASKYMESYFLSDKSETEMFLSEWNYFGAEHAFMMEVVDRYTNIMVFDESGDFVLDVDGFLSSGLWEDIKYGIENYHDVIGHIMIAIDNYKSEMLMKNSFERALQVLIDSVMSFVDRISQEGTEESLEALTNSIRQVGETLKDSPVGQIIEDANRK